MAGRKPKPTAVKKLEGNPGKRKLNNKEPVPAKGISIRDLDLLTIGMVNDMYVESNNDQDADKHYHTLASQNGSPVH